ncbi:MAG: hypothetical protein ACOC5T_03190 [Elusimicrobiota bacterium]
MKFDEFYNQEEVIIDIPIDFDMIRYNEEKDEINWDIRENDIPKLIKCGFFKKVNVEEATLGTMKKGVVKLTDPETGKETDFEASVGNSKIGGKTIVINMSTAKSCMSAIIGTCVLGAQGKCYSLKDFNRFEKKRERDIRQENQWACLRPESIAEGLNKIAQQFGGVQYVRINDAGEIRNLPTDPEKLDKIPEQMKADLADVDDVGKLKRIGEHLKKLGSNLILYTYTHRSDLEIGDLGSNICINGSGYMVDNTYMPLPLEEYVETMQLVKEGKLKKFNDETVKTAVACPGDCRRCDFCKKKEGKHIFLAIHGAGTQLQSFLRKVTNKITNNPEFDNILLNTKKSVAARAKEMYETLLDEEDKQKLAFVKPVPKDRYKFFEIIINNQEDVRRLAKAIKEYASEQNGEKNVRITNKMSSEGLARSVDALMGDFAANMERANREGQSTAEKKWDNLIKSIQKAIEDAKSGKEPKPSVGVGKKFSSMLKKRGEI